MSNRTPDRGRCELLELLEARRRAFLTLTPIQKAATDAIRFVPTAELHDILNAYLILGRFADEPFCTSRPHHSRLPSFGA